MVDLGKGSLPTPFSTKVYHGTFGYIFLVFSMTLEICEKINDHVFSEYINIFRSIFSRGSGVDVLYIKHVFLELQRI